MNDRDDILKAIGADIRQWTIGPGGISANGEEDTNDLMRVLSAQPQLLQVFARRVNPEAEALQQMMLDRINQVPAGQPLADSARPGNLPPNPLRMSQALKLYQAACVTEGLAEKTMFEREKLLNRLVAHVTAASPGTNADPFVHEIGTHHLSSFLDKMSMKAANDGSPTTEQASPRTVIKKVSTLGTFFTWAREEREATLVDPTAALEKRSKASRKSASKTDEHYDPFDIGQLERMFEPGRYLAFNNHPDYFWAPLRGLHLGTRLKEIVTLNLVDIERHEPTGIWFMDVAPENAKNRNSIRRLPITPRLMELGFVDYVERLRQLGATKLFPHRDLTSKTGRMDPSKNCSRKFADYLDTLGLVDDALVFHSFRHTVVTALQDAGTPLKDAMEITGHQAQEHAVRTGKISPEQANSVHVRTYTRGPGISACAVFPNSAWLVVSRLVRS